MSRRFLLDTNVWSDLISAAPPPKLLKAFARHEQEVALSATVWHELLFGVARLPSSRRKERLAQYLAEVIEPVVPILPYDERAARWHAGERARLYRKTPPYRDGEIAAVAVVNGLTLVTANTGDFTMFDGLGVENWAT